MVHDQIVFEKLVMIIYFPYLYVERSISFELMNSAVQGRAAKLGLT